MRRQTALSMPCIICKKKLYATTHKKCEGEAEFWWVIIKRLNEIRSKK